MANYYVFVGQKATTGFPHPRTGRMSYYGHYLCFNSESARQEYVDIESYALIPGRII